MSRSPTLDFVAECGLRPAEAHIDAETLARYNRELEVVRLRSSLRYTSLFS
jgi:hypothetical protein